MLKRFRLFTLAAAFIFMAAAIFCSCSNTTNSKCSIMSLKGPTSIGLAEIIKSHNDDYDFNIVGQGDAITSAIVSDKVDIALLPANLASILYWKTHGQIQVIDINTLGVLKCLSQNNNINTISDLQNKKIYITGKGQIPEYTINALLLACEIDYKQCDINFCSDSTEVAAYLVKDANAVGIINEPQASFLTSKHPEITEVIDLSKEWKNTFNSDPITGVTIARKDFIDNNPQIIQKFLSEHESSINYCINNSASAADAINEFNFMEYNSNLTNTLEKCNICFIKSNEMQKLLTNYFTILVQQNIDAIGGQIPDDNFYFIDNS